MKITPKGVEEHRKVSDFMELSVLKLMVAIEEFRIAGGRKELDPEKMLAART